MPNYFPIVFFSIWRGFSPVVISDSVINWIRLKHSGHGGFTEACCICELGQTRVSSTFYLFGCSLYDASKMQLVLDLVNTLSNDIKKITLSTNKLCSILESSLCKMLWIKYCELIILHSLQVKSVFLLNVVQQKYSFTAFL